MEKKVLIDLTNLKDPTCGFGQIARNYASLFSKIKSDKIRFVFLVPGHYADQFGRNVSYAKKTFLKKSIPFLLPKVDLWHSINQKNKLLRLPAGSKYLITIHDLNFFMEKSAREIKLRKDKMQKSIDLASAVTAISHYTANEIKQKFDLKGKEISVIPNGVEEITHHETKRPIFLLKDRPFFFSMGQILKKKNFHKLLDVMPAFPDHDLYICGNDQFKFADELRKEIGEKQIQNVFLTGKIAESEKVWMYKNCKAFFFPSEGEGFGLPAIEAMQFGKPVFSSNLASLPEVCGGHAYIWENLTPGHMIETVRKNLDNFYRDQNRIKKMKQYAASFNYETHIQSYVSLYHNLLSL